MKDRFQLQRLKEYLQKEKIPVKLQKEVDMVESPSYLSLIQLFEAFESLKNLAQVKILLKSELFSWKDSEILGLDDELNLASLLFELERLKEILQETGVFSFFQEFFKTSFQEGEPPLINKMLLRERGRDFYDEFSTLIEQFIQRHHPNEGRISFLLKDLRELKSLDLEEEGFKVRGEEENEAINLLTLHSSKGLEFEIVFPLGFISPTKVAHEYISIKKDGQIFLSSFGRDDPQAEDYLLEMEKERLRLFYVGATRAKQRLYLPLILNEGNHSSTQASSMELYLSHLAPKECDPLSKLKKLLQENQEENYFSLSPCERKEELFLSSKEESFSLIPPKKITLHAPSFPLYSFSRLTQNQEHPLKESLQDTNGIKSIHTMPMGKEVGVLIHEIFEKIPLRLVMERGEILPIVSFVRPFIEKSILEGWEEVIGEMINQVFRVPLKRGDEEFSLSSIDEETLLREVEFFYPANLGFEEVREGALKGVIDLIFYLNGKVYLIDWKTNWLGRDGEAYTKERISHEFHSLNYGLQAKIYKEALRRYLLLFDSRPFDEIFGGSFYIFLRGVRKDTPNSGIYFVEGEVL